ncbi:DUF1627 domain-containing protein [Salmonella enterica subsp. enterica]|nr:DUF1627 domain-containing protein [Salmonella enterica subsp. enterica]EFR9487985.1 DUF1627 domain-containing protein [Salmonella enterica]EHC6701434.1 DUF1627 domain-containing protein [Salmonella enterica subsp. enterica]EHI6477892.1 DUF1627 domain-containing protein [Salmonella enterica]EIK2672789.1 DUF1627 domain-containing protein [Salmonella enterica]
METVTDALKAMGKATAREIAARLGIEVRDALEMLREQQEAGAVEFLNGYWSLSGVTTEVKIGETQLLEAIKKQGPQTADELATIFGITSRKVTSTLAMATGKGRLIREYQNGRYYYRLPDEMLPEIPETSPASAEGGKPEAVTSAEPENAKNAPVERVAEGRIFPAPRFISAEIRRTEAKLKRLIKFREISRELHKPGNRRLLVQFFENNTDSEV